MTKNNLLTDRLIYNGDKDTPTHFHLCSYDGGSFDEKDGDSFGALLSDLTDGRMHWLQVHGLSDTDTVSEVCSHFGINFLTVQDILNVMHPSKIEDTDSYNFVISKISVISPETYSLGQTHVCLVQGERFLLTFVEKETGFFDDVEKAIRKNVLKIREKGSDYLFSVLMNGIVSNYMSVVSSIDDSLEEVESKLFDSLENRDIAIRIRLLRKLYLDMKQTVYPLKDQYSNFMHSQSPLIAESSMIYFNDVWDHLRYAVQTIESCRETLSSLMDLYISNNDLKMNNIMTRLTIVSSIFIPLTFLAGIWGMNFRFMPELDWKYGYLLAWGIMAVIGVVLYIYLKKKKW